MLAIFQTVPKYVNKITFKINRVENDFHCHLQQDAVEFRFMAVNYEQLSRVSSSAGQAPRPRIEWLVRGKPHDERALAYGFCAIGAFILGGFGYINSVLASRDFAISVVVAFVAFVLSYRHMEGS